MKMSELVKRLDRTARNREMIDSTELGYELDIHDMDYIQDEILSQRLQSFWAGEWLCTDTVVGYKVYFFDNEPVCWSAKTARKSDENFFWFSQEKAEQVRKYLLELQLENESPLSVELCDLENDDIGTGYTIDFSGQLLSNHKKAMLDGKSVTIIEKLKHSDLNIDTDLIVEFEDGSQRCENIEQLEFPFNLIKEGEQ